jgi:hypothetical protein
VSGSPAVPTDVVVELVDGPDVDYEEYAGFQREAFSDLLARNRASDAHMTPGFYRWKYAPPAGAGRIAIVRDSSGIVSSSAVLPLRFVIDGSSVVGWHCLDVATLPRARRRGLFLATLAALVEATPKGDLLFAFPNAASIPSFLRLGFVENTLMTTWIGAVPRLVRRARPDVEEVARFSPDHDALAGTGRDAGVAVDRTHEYLNWRYVDHPLTEYSCLVSGEPGREGICIVRPATIMGREFALVMELVGSSSAACSRLLTHAADRAVGSGLSKIAVLSTTMSPATALRSLLLPVPSALLPKRQVLVVRSGDEVAVSVETVSWAVQTGDWDVF